MAEDNMTILHSPHFDKQVYQTQINLISEAAIEARKRIDFLSAHDPDVLRAIDIVEYFLKKSHRMCYGGQAINAHLPAKYKFYDPRFNIPDYDFMTPEQDADIQTLSEMLRKAGFEEISAREGMHKGTIKLYVNYVPVADLTSVDPVLYTLLSEKAAVYDGISYMDADTLRMLMYLELSRPKGEVERWEKVYERLMLLNEFAPIRTCKRKDKQLPHNLLSRKEVTAIMDYVVGEKRIFAGGDVVGLYRSYLKRKDGVRRADWLLGSKHPLLFYSPVLDADTKHLLYELQHSKKEPTTVVRVEAMGGDLIPQMRIFMRRDQPFLILLEQSACHSYYEVPVKGGVLRVGTLDTLITLFFSLGLLKFKFATLKSMECLAKELVEISYRARANPSQFPFEFISLRCDGKQSSLPSLIREKVKRIRKTKRHYNDLILGPARSKTQKKLKEVV
jgi:hypothetical protein